MTTEVSGHCDRRFRSVRDTFAGHFDQGLEVGASVAISVDGESVVDLWGGFADAAGTRPWQRDTLVNVYSTTKAMAVTSTLWLVDRGELDLDAPVARVWPEFAQAGKEGVLVRHVLAHTSGVAGWDQKLTVPDIFDWDRMVALLAAQAPWWEPGTQSGYHAFTHGFLLGEIVRRVSGRTLGTLFREEIATPLGADFHIGLAQEHEGRVGEMIPAAPLGAGPLEPGSVAARVLSNPHLTGDAANQREWRAAELPASGGQGNARSVTRVASMLACGGMLDGVRILRAETVEKILEEQSYSTDLVLGRPARWGLGFALTSKELPLGPNPRAFGWGGWGGSLVLVDLDARVAFSYVMNRMGNTTVGDNRGLSLALAMLASLQKT
ncbi:MAG: beta-lactamase family protein [Proteobacteria bacterium]|nr:beta-lactamase family protein [Pseudomonadota bacterium]